MSDIVIRAEAVGKKYMIGHQVENGRYTALRDVLIQGARTVWDKTKDLAQGRPIVQGDHLEEVWALKDTNFEIRRGDAVGIIGRNGAGKSTLLKILSRITEPSTGRVTIRGRVASLLEVGTGFHPELTGRENIYLNGAILGMTRQEIKRKFEEIVAFAEVEKFLDTPVKRYSSGMYVRLAFAVAAHLEPEILVVDEVLAVGDLQFQQKCLGKMQDVSHSGRTVFFVSHNMSAINRLCTRALLLNQGSMVAEGTAAEVVSQYLASSLGASSTREWGDNENNPGSNGFRLMAVTLTDEEDKLASVVNVEQSLKLKLVYETCLPEMRFRCAALFYTQGVCAFSTLEPIEAMRDRTGCYTSIVTIPANLLAEGDYTITISVFSSKGKKSHLCRVKDVIAFQIFDPISGRSARGDYAEGLSGVIRPCLEWSSSYQG